MIEVESIKQLVTEYDSLEDKLSKSESAIGHEHQVVNAGKESVSELITEILTHFRTDKDKSYYLQMSLEDEISERLSKTANKLSPSDYFSLKIVDSFFSYLFEHIKLIKQAKISLFPLKIAMIRLTLKDQSVLENHSSLFYQLLEMFIQIAKYIDEHSGKRGFRLLAVMLDIGIKLGHKVGIGEKDFDKAMTAFNDYLVRFREESSKIEQEAIIDATREIAEVDAKIQASHEIAKHTEGEELPAFVIDFLQSVWAKYLKLTLLQHGRNSEQWCRAADDMRVLIWSITGPFDEAFREEFMSVIPESMKRIFLCLDSMHYDKEVVDNFFFSLESLHAEILQGKKITVDTVIAASIFDDSEDGESSKKIQTVSDSEGGNHAKFKKGDWVKLLDNDAFVTCKILSKFRTPDKTLFVNVSGEVIKVVSTQEFETYNSRQILPVKLNPVIQPALKYSETLVQQDVEKLKIRYRDFLSQKSKEKLRMKVKSLQERQKREKEALELKIREEAKRRWEAEKKRIEEEERMKELYRLDQENHKMQQATEVAAKKEAEKAASILEQEKLQMQKEAEKLAQEKREMERKLKQMQLEKAELEAEALHAVKEKERLSKEAKLAEDEARRIAKQAAEKIEREQYEKQCIQNIERIIPGTWMEIETEDNKVITCKLGLILQSTKKMIFVDRAGQQVFESTKQQLLGLLMEEKARILEFGVEFESTIESLVKSRRKDFVGR